MLSHLHIVIKLIVLRPQTLLHIVLNIYKTFLIQKIMLILQIVKVSDFGVARVQNKSGIMTAETGTYRWMAPEVGLSFFC